MFLFSSTNFERQIAPPSVVQWAFATPKRKTIQFSNNEHTTFPLCATQFRNIGLDPQKLIGKKRLSVQMCNIKLPSFTFGQRQHLNFPFLAQSDFLRIVRLNLDPSVFRKRPHVLPKLQHPIAPQRLSGSNRQHVPRSLH